MMKIAFAWSFAVRLMGAVRARLSIPCESVMDEEARILPRLADADVLVSMGFTREMAEAGRRLRLIQVPGAGLDRSALRPGMWLANAYGHETASADYIIGAMIAVTRRFARLDARLRQGQWESQWAIGTPAPQPWPELAGKTLGILGFGHIGQALAQRALAFDMRVCAIRRHTQSATPDRVWFVGSTDRLDDVVRQSDYLAVTLSLSPETRGLLDERRLSLMEPSAYLINIARAEIIDERHSTGPLASGRLAGAALDVWYRYPTAAGPQLPATQPCHELDNVIMTPHVSGWTKGMINARATLIAAKRVMRGEPPLGAIDPVS